jgi:phosphodiester glycosidase
MQQALLGLVVAGAAAAAAAHPAVSHAAAPRPPAASPAASAPAPATATPPAAEAPEWSVLAPGLDLGTFASTRAHGPDAHVRILRLDPALYRLRLFNASAPEEGRPFSARGWADRHGLVAVINSSMYQADMRSSVALMRTTGHVNNPRLSKDKAVLAFDAIEPGVPPVQIIDRECQDFDTVSRSYRTLIQSIRMVSCHGANVWSQQTSAWSTAAIGIDGKGRVLFIHARAPHTTHDLIATLLELPIDLKGAMYTEGGQEAQMFVRAGGKEYEFLGVVGDSGSDPGLKLAWPVPNVVGAEPIDAGAEPPAPPPARPR